jgi:hypothetical protein
MGLGIRLTRLRLESRFKHYEHVLGGRFEVCRRLKSPVQMIPPLPMTGVTTSGAVKDDDLLASLTCEIKLTAMLLCVPIASMGEA